ncbi:MAG: family 20 glycosylhydrolase [Pseudomonadales bacterium]|nr:family 20 glycosylhydrolase [Pseudomonadales bacterium]
MSTGYLSLLPTSASTRNVQWLQGKTPRLERALERLEEQTHCQIPLDISCAAQSPDHPQLHIDESYQLTVDSQSARICLNANSEWGILRAFATLTQLIFSENTVAEQNAVAKQNTAASKELGEKHIQHCCVTDNPEYSWRGLMLDPARHFLSCQAIRETLDLMFLFKLNVLHLHLTDDQGFRFFSPTYPELALIGGDGDYYRTEDLKALVSYASNRGIRIVPELDIPGHCTSWLAAKPEWGAESSEIHETPSRIFGGHKSCLDPSNPAVWTALKILLEELAEVFPDEYVHLGGDEVNPEWWSKNANINVLSQTEQLDTLSDLQNYFMTRAAGLANDCGKKVIGWDEILHPELPNSIVIQSWRSAQHRDIALNSGFDCIFSSGFYLDLFYPADIHHAFIPDAKSSELQKQEAGLLNDRRLHHVKDLNSWLANFHHQANDKLLPPTEIPAAQRQSEQTPIPGKILGGEACMWSELVTEPLLHTRIWTRMPLIAERLWHGSQSRADLYPGLIQAWDCMKSTLGIDITAPVTQFISSFKASNREQQLLGILLGQLEPTKSYARLLGDQAESRILGVESDAERPYNSATQLNRVVDLIPPESMTARNLTQLLQTFSNASPGTEQYTETCQQLEQACNDWQMQFQATNNLASQDSRLLEILPISKTLATLGEILQSYLSQDQSFSPDQNLSQNQNLDLGKLQIKIHQAMQAHGELILPVAIEIDRLLVKSAWVDNTAAS